MFKIRTTIFFLCLLITTGCESIFITKEKTYKDPKDQLTREDSLSIAKALMGEDIEFLMKGEFPEPVGGIESIIKKINYPLEAAQKGIEGMVLLSVKVTDKGDIEKISVVKSIAGGCTLEAIRAVRETKFIPGTLHGKPVNATAIIPIEFKLPKN